MLAADAEVAAAMQAEREAKRKEQNKKLAKYKDPTYKRRRYEIDRGTRIRDSPLLPRTASVKKSRLS